MTDEKKANAKLREYAKFLQDAYYGIYKELAEIKKENAELKAHCKAVDEVNEKMKCCENCEKERLCRRERITYGLGRCEEWEIKE